jgi:hypothetical protein
MFTIVTHAAPAIQSKKYRGRVREMPFSYGSIIEPPSEEIIGHYDRHHQKELCISEEELQRLEELSRTVQYAPWCMGKWVHRRPYPVDFTRVVKTRRGYRALHRRSARDWLHTLGNLLAGVPLLFPTAEGAIAASEVTLHELPGTGMLTWLP